jgi:hypothetical protein
MILQIILLSEYTHHTNMDAVHDICFDVSSDDSSNSSSCITSQDMGAPHYACVDVSSDNSSVQMIYYTHHRNMAVRHYVYVDVSSGPPSY